jgi:hypothetical protein
MEDAMDRRRRVGPAISREDVNVSQTLQEKLNQYPMFDQAITAHRFTSYMRDYDIVVEAPKPYPGCKAFTKGTYLYRFTHCVLAEVATMLRAEVWRDSWSEESLNDENVVWGAEFAVPYPGLTYVAGSWLAESWAQKLGQTMHEIVIQTNVFDLRLVFHDVAITKIAQGDPRTGKLTPI